MPLLALCLKEVHFIVMNLCNVMFFNGYEYDDKRVPTFSHRSYIFLLRCVRKLVIFFFFFNVRNNINFFYWTFFLFFGNRNQLTFIKSKD